MSSRSQVEISNDSEQELQRVLAALATVFAVNQSAITTSPQAREAADRYLTDFQKSSVAWIVTDKLLSRESADHASDGTSQLYFFAAQTIHVKCRADIMQFQGDVNQMNSLRESLMARLMKFTVLQKSGFSSAGAIITRLAMALCALAVQMQWDSIIEDLLSNLKQQQDLQQQQQMMHLVIDIAQLLPEEATSERLLLKDESQRQRFVQKLEHSSKDVLEFLLYCVSSKNNDANGTDSVKIKEKVLRCFHSWVRYINIPPALLEKIQLVDWAFSILQANDINTNGGDIFDISVDVIIEILRCYPSIRYENKGLVHKMIPLVMALGKQDNGGSPFQKAVQEEDEDEMRDYCRIFTEMGESYMSLIMHHEDLNQVALVELVLACSAIPDNEIANITLHFWYRFVSWLEDLEPYEYRQLQIDNFTPQIIKLVSACTSLLRYPEDIDSLPEDRIDDIHRNRFYVKDTLEDCCRLMGADIVLKNVGSILHREVERISSLSQNDQLSQWHTIESCLCSLSSFSRYIHDDENEVLPFVMSMIPKLPTSVSYLRISANFLVGSYSHWFNRHAEQLHPILPFLSQGLSEPKCASSAAVAIKQLCENCSSTFALGDSVLQLYDGIVAARAQQQQQSNQQPILDIKDELEVLEGACKAISRQLKDGSTDISSYISRIVEPIGARLVHYAAKENTAGPKEAVTEVERLTVVVRFLDIPQVQSQPKSMARAKFLTDLMTQCWPYVESISLKHTDFNMAEKICRLHKHCLRNCGAELYKPMLDRLCTHLVNNYAHSHQSPYLYAASICIAEYGKDRDCAQKLLEMLLAMGKTSFQILSSMDDFKAHPDVVEELFFLAGRMIQVCPEPFISSAMFHPFIQCAVVGMKQDHKDANRGSMSFLDNTLSYGVSIQGAGQQHQCTQSLEQVIGREGEQIVMNLILALIGDLPCYRIATNTGSVAGVLHKLQKLCPGLLMGWMSAPLSKVSDTEKEILLNARNGSKADFFKSCERFAAVCSRSQKMGK